MTLVLQLVEVLALTLLVALPLGALYSLGFKPHLRHGHIVAATKFFVALLFPLSLFVVAALPHASTHEAREELNSRYGLELSVAEVNSLFSPNFVKPGEERPTTGAKVTVEGKPRYLVLVREDEKLFLYDGLTQQKIPEVPHG